MADFLEEIFDDASGSAARKARSARKPWWQLAKTARQAFIFGGAYLTLGTAALMFVLLGRHGFLIMLAIWWLTSGCFYLASSAAMRRRDRLIPNAGPDPRSERPTGVPGKAGPV